MTVCDDCRRTIETRDGLCFACRIRTVGFTFRGAHPGRRGWNEATVRGTQREIYEHARDTGQDIARV